MNNKFILVFSIVAICTFCTILLGADTRYLTNNGPLALHHLHVGLTEVRMGSTAPTKITVGTTPAVNGLLFDAVNEVYQVQFMVPDDWTGTDDITMDLFFALEGGETAGDSIAFTGDYVAGTVGTDTVTKTSTQLLVTELVVAGCVAANCLYKVTFTLDYDDADNPLAVDDVMVMDIHRTNITNVAGVILVSIAIHAPIKL